SVNHVPAHLSAMSPVYTQYRRLLLCVFPSLLPSAILAKSAARNWKELAGLIAALLCGERLSRKLHFAA
ncbi:MULTISPECIES: hypothetical protein, partial [Paraburkholderia]